MAAGQAEWMGARGARGASSQSSKVRVAGPPMKAWVVLAVVLAAGLIALAALFGTRPNGNQPVDVLPVVGDPIEETLRRPAVAAFLAAMVLVLLAAAVRRARLRWLALTPGPVDVADLKAAGSLPDGLAERLTLRFRERLADLHLATPGPQPGIAPATNFVDLIGSATRDSKNLFATVAGLLRVAWPSQAYQVQAALVEHAKHGCGVSVQVVMLPTTTTPPTTCWAASWETAIDRAANHAAAFIVPRTRVSRRPPWTSWNGYVLPPPLLDAYEQAAVCTHDHRYDEALREYYTALELDPKNLDVRLRIGFIQEKLGLALDALTTYQAMCDMTSDCPAPGTRRSAKRAVASSRRRSQNIAAYRRAVLLGAAESLSKQWCAPSEPGEVTRRDEQRRVCRERLRPTLMTLCERQWNETEAKRKNVTREALLADPPEIARCDDLLRRREDLLSEVFQLIALDALAKLRMRLPRQLRHGDQSSLTRPAVALSEKCVGLRLRSTRRALHANAKPDRLTLESPEGRLCVADPGKNAPWSELYSAASFYALSISDVNADELAEKAVSLLERAIESADSGYVASRRSWLVSEDPDFEALRPTPQFQRFEATYFPSRNPTKRRPPGAHRWEVVEYVHQLVGRCADRREDMWRAQLLAGEPDRLPRLRREEFTAWELVSEVASNCEHWQTRLKLVEALEKWTAQTGGAAPVGYPDYAAVAPDGIPFDEAIDNALDRAIKDARDRLAAVHMLAERQRADLSESAGSAPAGRGRIRPSESRATRSHFVRLCRERTTAWQKLGNTLKPPPSRQLGRAAPTPDRANAALNAGHRRFRWRRGASGDRNTPAANRTRGSAPAEDQ